MAPNDYDGLTVAVGHWLYDSTVLSTVEVVAFDCDYFFERMPTEDGRDPWTPYPLNGEGRLYYLKSAGDVLPTKPFQSIEEAKGWADSQPWAPIKWG